MGNSHTTIGTRWGRRCRLPGTGSYPVGRFCISAEQRVQYHQGAHAGRMPPGECQGRLSTNVRGNHAPNPCMRCSRRAVTSFCGANTRVCRPRLRLGALRPVTLSEDWSPSGAPVGVWWDGRFRLSAGWKPNADYHRPTLTFGPRGAHTSGFVGPNRAITGVPTAAARWVMPESFPM